MIDSNPFGKILLQKQVMGKDGDRLPAWEDAPAELNAFHFVLASSAMMLSFQAQVLGFDS